MYHVYVSSISGGASVSRGVGCGGTHIGHYVETVETDHNFLSVETLPQGQNLAQLGVAPALVSNFVDRKC